MIRGYKYFVLLLLSFFTLHVQAGSFKFSFSGNQKAEIGTLTVELTNTETKQKINLLAGEYNLKPGNYSVKVYRYLSDITKPIVSYQSVVDSIYVSDYGSVERIYNLPKRRELKESHFVLGILGSTMLLSPEHEVPTIKYLIDLEKGNDGSAYQPGQSFEGSIFDQGNYMGLALYGQYQFNGQPWIVEGQYSYQANDSSLSMSTYGAGVGLSGQISNWRYWGSVGAEVLDESISDLSINTNSEPINIEHSELSPGGYIQFGFSPKGGGVLGLIKYNVSENIISLQIGWNFGSTSQNYDISPETNVK